MNASVVVCGWCDWRLTLDLTHTPVYASVVFDAHLDKHVEDMIRTASTYYDDDDFIEEL